MQKNGDVKILEYVWLTVASVTKSLCMQPAGRLQYYKLPIEKQKKVLI